MYMQMKLELGNGVIKKKEERRKKKEERRKKKDERRKKKQTDSFWGCSSRSCGIPKHIISCNNTILSNRARFFLTSTRQIESLHYPISPKRLGW
jgi:hypothetical protein